MSDNIIPDSPNEKNHQDPEKGQVLLYQTDNNDLRLECRFIEESLWLSINQMAELFGRDKSVNF